MTVQYISDSIKKKGQRLFFSVFEEIGQKDVFKNFSIFSHHSGRLRVKGHESLDHGVTITKKTKISKMAVS